MTLAPCFHCGGPVDADGESTALSAASEAEALRAALENILDQFNRDNIGPAQAAFHMADIARAALATPAPAAPAEPER